MKKLLLFGGVSEEHDLIKELASYPVAVTLCVAGQHGRGLLPEESGRLTVRAGPMEAEQMADMMREQGFSWVVDATHPYAAEASRNIKRAAERTNIPYLRLRREKSDTTGCIVVPSVAAAAEGLQGLEGPALITTGSKELAPFTRIPDFKERLYLRVLPTIESLRACLALGFPAGRIIAMQGPFSRELNTALMRQLAVKILVTKDGGQPGGFPEKLAAAKELGLDMIVVGRTEEEGLAAEEVVPRLLEMWEGRP